MYDYVRVASYTQQVQRYLDRFDRDQIHFLLYEDLAADPRSSYAAVLAHLGLRDVPLDDSRVINAHRVVRWPRFARVMRSPKVIGGAKRVVPRPLHPVAGRVSDAHERLNRRTAPSAKLEPAVVERLRHRTAADVERLSLMLGRDLTQRWR
jgi:hypothetical protein